MKKVQMMKTKCLKCLKTKDVNVSSGESPFGERLYATEATQTID